MLSLTKVIVYANIVMASANLFDGDVGKTRIIGGKELTEDSAPYSVALMDEGFHFCGGSLITNRVVLTAAHCLGGTIDILVGRHDFDDKDGEVIRAKRQIPHPRYNDETQEFDMALIILSRPVSIGVQAITVNDDSSFPSSGSVARVMGWGNRDEEGFDLPDTPHFADVNVISNQRCENMERDGDSYGDMKYEISDDMMCTYTANKDACQGDSGGPLVVRGNDANGGQDVLIGVTSWGVGCAFLPGVYGRVSRAFEWIQREACEVTDDTSGTTLCGTQQPSSSPTISTAPTVSPSEKPSWVPSTVPSAVPSLSTQPTESPTSYPSLRPSSNPTSTPSASPSSTPTFSSRPTSHPSSTPSDVPSISPTATPSNSPSQSHLPTLSTSPSSMPTDPKPLIVNAMQFIDGEGNLDRNASNSFGSYAKVGSLMSIFITGWLLY